MKITRIESLQWRAYPRLMAVRVHTDSGIVGLGETVDKIPGAKAALAWHDRAFGTRARSA